MDPLVEFDALFAGQLKHRADSFRAVFAALLERGQPVSIVETGCLREFGNWAGDGQSTVLFAWLIGKLGGTLHCVDLDDKAVAMTRATVPRAEVVQNDSIKYLAGRTEPIDLLYLDSLESPDQGVQAKHQLFELAAARHLLHPGSIIMTDDTYEVGEGLMTGKGIYIAELMKHLGIERIANGYQMAWRLPNGRDQQG